MTAALGLGLSIGVLLGLLGGGASILAVPALVYRAGVPLAAAVPTSLLVVGISSATAGQVWAELGLWLALHDPAAGRLVALGDAVDAALVPALNAFPGMTSTTALIGAQALAALIGPDTAAPTDSFTFGVRPFGPDGTDLAQRLAAHVRAWDAAGRPSTPSSGFGPIPYLKPPPTRQRSSSTSGTPACSSTGNPDTPAAVSTRSETGHGVRASS